MPILAQARDKTGHDGPFDCVTIILVLKRKKAVLLVGGSGFIGTHLALRLRDNFKVFATYRQTEFTLDGVTTLPLDVKNRDWIKRVVYQMRPDVIVYLAGKESVEWAEKESKYAELVHSAGPITVLTAAEIMAPKFIYVSSPYVYDGEKGNYHETDTPLPWTNLGKHKLRSENFVKGKSLNYVIVRTAPLFGRGNGRHLSWLDQLRISLDRGKTFEAYFHELHGFAPIYGFTELIERLIDGGLKNRIVHYGGLTRLSHYELAVRFAKRFGYDPNLVVPKKMARDTVYDYSINCSDTAKNLKLKPLLVEEGFDLLEKRLVAPG